MIKEGNQFNMSAIHLRVCNDSSNQLKKSNNVNDEIIILSSNYNFQTMKIGDDKINGHLQAELQRMSNVSLIWWTIRRGREHKRPLLQYPYSNLKITLRKNQSS